MQSLVIIIVALTILACSKDDDLKTIPPPYSQPQNLDEAITNLFEPMVQGDTTVGIAVGLIKGGDQYHYFYGERQKGSGIAPDEGTLFEIGSITKTFTTTILADLALSGDLDLNDPVSRYYPSISEFPRDGDQEITFQHLANHTSSLPRLPDNHRGQHFDRKNPYQNYTASMMYEFLDGYKLPYPIGSKEDYSNLGMGLLGHTLGKIKNTSFNDLLLSATRELGMHQSYINKPEQIQNYAQPYDGDLKAVPMWEMSEPTLGAGGLKSTLEDLMIYLAINMGQLSSPMDQAIALTHSTSQDLNYPFVMGLGWNKTIKESDQTELIWHDGGTAGTVSMICFVKQLQMGVVLLFNTEIYDRIGAEFPLALIKAIQAIEAMKAF